ncbi:SUKH-3 domain-containing protein [Streptomyces violascens]|uniref:SUKH-3 domain-containing protein n=1 Tax=Streptomyces violascens TaxID=67381 RepID=UPI00378A6F72
MSRFSAEVELTLRNAGWSSDRKVDIKQWKELLSGFTWHAIAERFLQEFGGIRVDVSGPGVNCAREPFEIDPELAVGEEDRFAQLSNLFKRKFFPIGEVGRGEFFLAIDEEGFIYLLSAWALRIGPSDVALDHLIRGVAAERLDPPVEG